GRRASDWLQSTGARASREARIGCLRASGSLQEDLGRELGAAVGAHPEECAPCPDGPTEATLADVLRLLDDRAFRQLAAGRRRDHPAALRQPVAQWPNGRSTKSTGFNGYAPGMAI